MSLHTTHHTPPLGIGLHIAYRKAKLINVGLLYCCFALSRGSVPRRQKRQRNQSQHHSSFQKAKSSRRKARRKKYSVIWYLEFEKNQSTKSKSSNDAISFLHSFHFQSFLSSRSSQLIIDHSYLSTKCVKEYNNE